MPLAFLSPKITRRRPAGLTVSNLTQACHTPGPHKSKCSAPVEADFLGFIFELAFEPLPYELIDRRKKGRKPLSASIYHRPNRRR
jgi:hypothetical protein